MTLIDQNFRIHYSLALGTGLARGGGVVRFTCEVYNVDIVNKEGSDGHGVGFVYIRLYR